jgi:hypothetical protein
LPENVKQLTGGKSGSTTWLEIMVHPFLVKMKELSQSEREQAPTCINLISSNLRLKLRCYPALNLSSRACRHFSLGKSDVSQSIRHLFVKLTPCWITPVIRLCRSVFQLCNAYVVLKCMELESTEEPHDGIPHLSTGHNTRSMKRPIATLRRVHSAKILPHGLIALEDAYFA